LAAGSRSAVAVDRSERGLLDLPSGVIVHVAARPGVEPAGGMAAYSVSKAALVHLTRTLAIELGAHGIRVNVVVRQLLDTPANRAMFPAEVMSKAVAPGSDRRRDRLPRQRRRSPSQWGDPAGVWRLGRPHGA
jgi:NAD(P)-dependent dehydrogenase (short-subunit alcohol dehydrogenase family)